MKQCLIELGGESVVPGVRSVQAVFRLGAEGEAHTGQWIDQAGCDPRGRRGMMVVDDTDTLAGLYQMPGKRAAGQALADNERVEMCVWHAVLSHASEAVGCGLPDQQQTAPGY